MLKNLKWLQQVPKKMPFKVGSLVFLQKTSCFHPGNSKLFCIFLLFRIYGAFLSHGGNPPVIIHSDGIFPNENHPCLGFSYGFPMGFLFGVPPPTFYTGTSYPPQKPPSDWSPHDLPKKCSSRSASSGLGRQFSTLRSDWPGGSSAAAVRRGQALNPYQSVGIAQWRRLRNEITGELIR